MKPAANYIIHFFCRVRPRLGCIDWASLHRQDPGIAATQRENHALRILHSSVIQMRSRLQSL
jgi:hypothetical protein